MFTAKADLDEARGSTASRWLARVRYMAILDACMKSITHYRRAVAQHGSPVKFVLGRILVKTRACVFLTINCGLYRLRFAPSVYTLNYWLRPDIREWPEHAFLLAYLRTGDTVVDVGANQGMMALTAASSVGPTGKVFAMEPHPDTFAKMQKNISINGALNIYARNVAVGASAGKARFSDDHNDSGNSVSPDGPLSVPVETLDCLMSAIPTQIAMIKIDVEGYEKFVLDGAARTLSRTACVYFEAHDAMYARQGYRCAEVVALLHRWGFHVYRWLPGNAFINEIDETYKTSEVPENLVAVRDITQFLGRTGSRYQLC